MQFKIKTHLFTYAYPIINCTTKVYETTSILLIKFLKMPAHSQINLCHFAVQVEHWQLLFQYPKYHFWNKSEVLIHSTNNFIEHLLWVRHYAGCWASKMGWFSDFRRILVSKAVLLKLHCINLCPPLININVPSHFSEILMDPPTLRTSDTQNVVSTFCVSFTDQMSLSFYFLLQKQRIYFSYTKLDWTIKYIFEPCSTPHPGTEIYTPCTQPHWEAPL